MATKRKSKAPTGIDIKTEDEWMVCRDMETLMEAEKIKADPERLKKAQAMAKTKMLSMAKVATDD